MAKEEVVRRRKRSGKGSSGQRDGRRNAQKGESPAGGSPSNDNEHIQPETADDLRKARLTYLEKAPEERRKVSMKYVGEKLQKESPTSTQAKRTTTPKKRPRPASETGHRRHRKARVSRKDADDSEHVYPQSQTTKSHRKSTLTSRTHVLPSVAEEDTSQEPTTKQNVQQQYAGDSSERRHSGSHRSESTPSVVDIVRRPQRESDPIWRLSIPRQRSASPQRRPARTPRRSSSTHEGVSSSRPNVRRSSTTLQSRHGSRVRVPPKRSLSTTSVTTKDEKRPTGIFATFLKGPGQLPQHPEKKVACLTCLDDTPVSKTAKLACSHRMCHTCLKRIFTMSVTDPAHMPPKCCTSEHIPLKHVDKLFDQKFKVTWNRKFEEYTTRNRIYCPSKGCGEWIKPNHITIEQGRKVGKCKKCGARVCGSCNNRMHTTKECPKDEATKRFVEVAKKEGWQRCYNCKMMVELKEGCNHMTCRCTAEFCMICGNKWKTCDCPWFNYDAVEADLLLHMNIPEARRAFAIDEGRAPIRYQEELDRRREQEQRDEALARRLQALGMNEAPGNPGGGQNNHQPEIIGIGNAAVHLMNQNFRPQAGNLLSGNFQNAIQGVDGLLNGAFLGRENPLPPAPFEVPPPLMNPPPMANEAPMDQAVRLREPHSDASRAYNLAARPNERVVPSRRAIDHAAEAARYRPLSRRPLPEDMNMNPAPPRRTPVRRNARLAPSRGASAMEEMVTNDEVTTTQTDNRIENWRRGVPMGELGPGPESASSSSDDADDSMEDSGSGG